MSPSRGGGSARGKEHKQSEMSHSQSRRILSGRSQKAELHFSLEINLCFYCSSQRYVF